MTATDNERTPDPDWCVTEESFDIATNRHHESIFALGTGYLSTRSSIDEGFTDDPQSMEYDWFPGNTTLMSPPVSKSKWGTYMPVLAARHPFRRMGLVNLPYYLGFVPAADGEKLDLENSEVADNRRWLDLRTATLYRTLTWHTRAGSAIGVRFVRFMDPSLRFVCVQRCELTMVAGESRIAVTSFVDNDVRTNGYDKFSERSVGSCGDSVIYSDVTTNVGNRVVTATATVAAPGVKFETRHEDRRISARAEFALAEGEMVTATKVSAVIADTYHDREGLLGSAAEIVRSTIAVPFDGLHRRHAEEWQRRWQVCDVQIDADDSEGYNSQLAIRQAIYHLLRAKGEDESRNLVDPKGMIGDLYYGAAFWDMEIFINPFFIYTNPVTARNTPMYRYNHLSRARALARSYGYSGARYPWMQALDGDPVVSLWQYADHQIHVTADVVVGMWHYVRATGDTDFLFDCGAEMIVETARYWRERVDTIDGRPGYHIYGVMGPDEYKPLTNNNAYTNYFARVNLELAGDVVEMMKAQAPAKLETLRDKIGLTDAELAAFADIAEGLVIPTDPERNIVWQCDGFDTAFAEIDIDAVWKDKTVLFGKYMSQEKLFRYKTMKQSDVVALMSVFPDAFTAEQKEASFDYYKQYNIHDSSNSMCHHMIVAANIGRREEAYEAWLRSIDIDFGAEPRSSDGVHCANVGGMWQEVVFGFAGLTNALCSEAMRFRPCMPEQIKRVTFKILWKGARARVIVDGSRIEVENLSDREVEFEVSGTPHRVAPRSSAVCGYQTNKERSS